MRKLVRILGICCLGLVLTACGTQKNAESEIESETRETVQTETVQTEPGEEETSVQTEGTQNTSGTVQTDAGQPETVPVPESVPEADSTQTESQEATVPSADWNGTFSNGEEQVTLAAADSTSFEFQFASSGIAGVARVGEDPSTATFTGDDNIVITFGISGSSLSVSVSSPDAEGEVASTISGNYELVK